MRSERLIVGVLTILSWIIILIAMRLKGVL